MGGLTVHPSIGPVGSLRGLATHLLPAARCEEIMSNFLAIATVSAALQRLLEPAVDSAVSGAHAWIGPPNVARATPGVNIHLYNVAAGSARRDPQLRRPDGGRADSLIALELHYLLTFHGDEERLEPQRLFGAAIAMLHGNPLITASLLAEVLAAAADTPPRHDFLAAGDLSDIQEPIGLDPDPLTLDELAHLWTLYPSTAHPLSWAVIARTVWL